MKISIVSRGQESAAEIEIDDEVFGIEPREDILSRVVTWQLAKRQAGTHKVKERGDVSGTTKKMYKQKGTGGARHGSRRGAQFRGGGIIFGPVVRDHSYDLQKKIRKLGLKMALSAKAATGNLFAIDDLTLAHPKTSLALDAFGKFQNNKVLFIDGESVDFNMHRALSNIPYYDILPQIGANVYDILRKDTLILSFSAIKGLEARLK